MKESFVNTTVNITSQHKVNTILEQSYILTHSLKNAYPTMLPTGLMKLNARLKLTKVSPKQPLQPSLMAY